MTTGSYTYDLNGNPTTYNGTALTFDANNQMTSYGGTTLTAGYLADGRRAWKQTASGRTYFLYDGMNIVCELDNTGALTATNTWGANGLVSRRVGSTSTFYTFDQRGTTVQRLDVNENVLSSHMADAFGTLGSVPITNDPYDGFGAQWGYYTDHETGLQLLGFRYYDQAIGRFVTRDPVAYEGGANLYSYVGNQPIDWTDSSGLVKIPLGKFLHWVKKPLPVDKFGNKIRSSPYAHTQLGYRHGRKGPYIQTRTWGEGTKHPLYDVDWSDHGRWNERGHTIPHMHRYDQATGKRLGAEPFEIPSGQHPPGALSILFPCGALGALRSVVEFFDPTPVGLTVEGGKAAGEAIDPWVKDMQKRRRESLERWLEE